MIKGIPWSVIKEKRNDPAFDFKSFVDGLNKDELATLMECMEQSPTMEGRIIEATELIGLVPKIMKQGGLTDKERARIEVIMNNFN